MTKRCGERPCVLISSSSSVWDALTQSDANHSDLLFFSARANIGHMLPKPCVDRLLVMMIMVTSCQL
eukprot:scaffold181511_cov19-Prasinocladus_malaysianus.AAC.2